MRHNETDRAARCCGTPAAAAVSIADEPAIVQAILNAANTLGAADACDPQPHNPHRGTLHMHAQHGFTAAFLAAFETIPVASYPLRHAENGPVFGVLSFHYRRPALDRGDPAVIAHGASRAFAHLPPR